MVNQKVYRPDLRQPYPNELYHHGIKGQKWGVRRFQNSDGSLTPAGIKRYASSNLKKAKVSNLNKWGKTKDTNTLYIMGQSGSGKSTTALGLAKKGDTVVHLDHYTETDGNTKPSYNKKFNAFLNSEVPNWKSMKNATMSGENGTMKRYTKEYWETVDKFTNAIDRYSKQEFNRGHKVVVEGVQLLDEWYSPKGADYFKGKPTVIMGTSPILAMSRAISRDGKGISTNQKKQIQQYIETLKSLDNYSKELHAESGRKWLLNNQDFLKEFM